MKTTHVYFKEEKNLDEKDIFSGFSKRVNVGDEEDDFYSYEESNIRMCVQDTGALYISEYNKDGGVYLYPDQLEHLKAALNIALKARDENKEKS